GGGPQAQRRRAPLLRAAPPPQQGGEEEQLQERERAGGGQVQRLRRQPVDLDLERGVLRTAEQEHDPERREREQEGDRRRRRDGGPPEWERHLPERSPAVGAEAPRRLLEPGIEVGPQRRDRA